MLTRCRYDTMKTIKLSPEPLERTNEDDDQDEDDDDDDVPSFLKTDPVFLADDDPDHPVRRISKPPVRVASPQPQVPQAPGVAEQLDLVAMLESHVEQVQCFSLAGSGDPIVPEVACDSAKLWRIWHFAAFGGSWGIFVSDFRIRQVRISVTSFMCGQEVLLDGDLMWCFRCEK